MQNEALRGFKYLHTYSTRCSMLHRCSKNALKKNSRNVSFLLQTYSKGKQMRCFPAVSSQRRGESPLSKHFQNSQKCAFFKKKNTKNYQYLSECKTKWPKSEDFTFWPYPIQHDMSWSTPIQISSPPLKNPWRCHWSQVHFTNRYIICRAAQFTISNISEFMEWRTNCTMINEFYAWIAWFSSWLRVEQMQVGDNVTAATSKANSRLKTYVEPVA